MSSGGFSGTIDFTKGWILILLCWLVSRAPAVRPILGALYSKVTAFLLQRSPFVLAKDHREIKKLALIKTITLVVIICRLLEIMAHEQSAPTALALHGLALLLCLGALMTRWSAIAMCIIASSLNTIIDPLAHVLVLGSYVASMLLWFFACLELASGKPLRLVSFEKTKPSLLLATAELNLYKTGLLLSYWAVALYSGLLHLADHYWQSGAACAIVLLSKFMDPKLSWFFSMLYRENNALFTYFSVFSTWAMMAWMILMPLLLFLSRASSTVTIIWGLLFFLLDTFVLDLIGGLGPLQLCLWSVLFLPVSKQTTTSDSAQAGLPSRGFSLVISAAQALLLGFALINFPPLQTRYPGADQVGKDSTSLFFGIGPLVIFNTMDLSSLGRGLKITSSGRLLNHQFSESSRYSINQMIRTLSFSRLFAPLPAQFKKLEEAIDDLATCSHLAPETKLDLTFEYITLPTISDWQQRRYVEPNCNQPVFLFTYTTGKQGREDESTAPPGEIRFLQAGLDYAWRDLPYKLNADKTDLIYQFPAPLEERLFFNFIAQPQNSQAQVQAGTKLTEGISKLVSCGPNAPQQFLTLESLIELYPLLKVDPVSERLVMECSDNNLLLELEQKYCAILHGHISATGLADKARRQRIANLRRQYFAAILKN